MSGCLSSLSRFRVIRGLLPYVSFDHGSEITVGYERAIDCLHVTPGTELVRRLC